MLSRLNKRWLFALSVIAVISVVFIIRPVSIIQVTSTDLQCSSALQTFTLQWIHSVEKERWQETYQVAGQQLLLTTTQFKTFGAGTPGRKGAIASTDGWLHFQVDRLLPQIHWVVSRYVESTMLTELGAWPLYQGFDDYTEIQIQIMRVPRWYGLTLESCDDYFKATRYVD